MKLFHMEDARLRRTALLALALVVLTLIVHEIFGENGYLAMRHKRQELQTLQLQIEKLKLENQRLEQQIKGLKTDPKAIEKLAREQMKMARPGELIYVLPEKDAKDEPSATAQEKPPKQ
jgi:cell division protein FtsL